MKTYFGTSPVGSHLAIALQMRAERPYAAVSRGVARAYWPAYLLPVFELDTCHLALYQQIFVFPVRNSAQSQIMDRTVAGTMYPGVLQVH
jgi:hypothetical protein